MRRWVAFFRLRSCVHAAAAMALVSGCGGGGVPKQAEQGPAGAQLSGETLSTVNGTAITVAEVQALVNETGLAPREALERLQAQALLMDEAQRRGYAARSSVRLVGRKAAVQALLAAEIETLHASEPEIAAAYERNHERYTQPERRGSSHILALLPRNATQEQDEAARAFAVQACQDLALSTNLEAVLEGYRRRSSPMFKVSVETLPSVANDGSFVESYMQALFSLKAPGPVLNPVRTEYGWHAIVVTEITPAVRIPLADAKPGLVKEIETQAHKAALDALVARLRAGTSITYDAKGRNALGTLDL
ncbi:MAG TPA: peptidyl-prolyl cis-trans isomerase [Polyangiales bacterium]